MWNLFIRILKHGLPTALALAVIGFLLAEGASLWMQGHTPQRTSVEPIPYANAPRIADDESVAQGYRHRLPIMMAAWGFGLVVVFELLLFMLHGNAPKPAKEPTPTHNDSTEELLNQLMAKAEAAEASRK